MGAVIATLKDGGWRPISPTEWRRPVGPDTFETWQFPDISADRVAGDFDIAELVVDFAEDLKAQLWQQASKHPHGEDLAAGADVTSIRCQIQRLIKREEFDQVGQLVTVAAGGQWPHQRQREQGYLVSLKCPRCGAPEESLFHRI